MLQLFSSKMCCTVHVCTPILQHLRCVAFPKVIIRAFHQKPHQVSKQVFFLENTSNQVLCFPEPYQMIHDLKKLGVKSIKDGFRRRPELIIQRQPDAMLPSTVKTYGLFDKCERIQRELTMKLLELMGLKDKNGAGHWLLDVGCGHGWSLNIPAWKGFDVTAVDFDLQALGIIQHKVHSGYLPPDRVHIVRSDLSQGFCFKDHAFDFAISISFLQWLCVGKRADNSLARFFSSLQRILKPCGMAGIQFYPRNVGDVSRVISHAQNNFKGALVSDFPHIDRGRKLFLVLVNDR